MAYFELACVVCPKFILRTSYKRKHGNRVQKFEIYITDTIQPRKMIIYGYKHQGGYEIPDWAGKLKEYYWFIRVEGRDKSKQRRYYRYVAKEKLRLAELNINQELIEAVCRYLAGLGDKAGCIAKKLEINPSKQMFLDFYA